MFIYVSINHGYVKTSCEYLTQDFQLICLFHIHLSLCTLLTVMMADTEGNAINSDCENCNTSQPTGFSFAFFLKLTHHHLLKIRLFVVGLSYTSGLFPTEAVLFFNSVKSLQHYNIYSPSKHMINCKSLICE